MDRGADTAGGTGSLDAVRAAPRAMRQRASRASACALNCARMGVLACALLAGCHSGKVASANLDSLHDSDGRYRYRARLLSPSRAFFSRLVNGLGLDEQSLVLHQKEVDVKNPARKTLDYLLTLAADAGSGESRPSLRAQRVRQYAYLGCRDPSALVRERALIELGFLAAAAGLERPAADGATPANALELSEAIAGLAEVVRPIAATRGALGETESADLAAACEVLEDMQIDVDGAHRLLAVIAVLLDRRDPADAFAPVARLSERVERSMVQQALAVSLDDQHPLARAAAFEANWRAYGDVFLREALQALLGSAPTADALFALRPVWPGDEEIFETVFRIVREHGLPGPPEDRAARLEYLYALCSVAIQYTIFSDRTRNAAMLALSEASGTGMRSLRLEDWQIWWQDHGEPERAALRAAQRAPQPQG